MIEVWLSIVQPTGEASNCKPVDLGYWEIDDFRRCCYIGVSGLAITSAYHLRWQHLLGCHLFVLELIKIVISPVIPVYGEARSAVQQL
jgi:hypothetical protein